MRITYSFGLAAGCLVLALAGPIAAQEGMSPTCPTGYGLGTCGTGEVTANCVDTRTGYPRWDYRLRYANWDKISPHPYYSYSRRGIEAQLTHQWNQQQMNNYAWHCNNSYWMYGRPTALVVPPNSSFQSIYSWGVGQTRSVPIYHQFGRPYPGTAGGPRSWQLPGHTLLAVTHYPIRRLPGPSSFLSPGPSRSVQSAVSA